MSKERKIRMPNPNEFHLKDVSSLNIPLSEFNFRDSRTVAMQLLGAEVTIKDPEGDRIYIVTHTHAYGQDAGAAWKPLRDQTASTLVGCSSQSHILPTWKTGERDGTSCVLLRGVNRQLTDGTIQPIEGPSKVAREFGLTEVGQTMYVVSLEDTPGQVKIVLSHELSIPQQEG